MDKLEKYYSIMHALKKGINIDYYAGLKWNFNLHEQINQKKFEKSINANNKAKLKETEKYYVLLNK